MTEVAEIDFFGEKCENGRLVRRTQPCFSFVFMYLFIEFVYRFFQT